MKNQRYLLLLLFVLLMLPVHAQRKYQDLDRGVVASCNGTSASSPVLVSWRLLAQDPESIRFNLYCNPGGTGSYTLLNTTGPLTKTNFSTTAASVPNNSLLCVAPVVNGVEGVKSLPFRFVLRAYRSMYLDITYSTFLPHTDYVTKFIWPADLDGDGEYDFVVDRLSRKGGSSKIEGYLRTGEKLWTVDMGPNVAISQGHDDMVLAYDMNCDGKAEVVIKSSDGTRFWDKTNENWGKYLLNSTNGDTDNDGIINYTTQWVKNEPQYITVINGMTGEEMSTVEMPYPSTPNHTYTRTNKSFYMASDNYNSLNGHMGIVYLDGVHPSVVMEYKVRAAESNASYSKFHFYYVTAWGYKFVNGQATTWEQKYHWNRDYQNASEFHHIRVADVDMDGKDEMLEGGYTIDDNGSLLFSAYISHGDRFRVGDINPDRPGLETFAIQQNAGDALGQVLYDSRTGTAIKKWYLAGVGDVGRGECIDIMPEYKGYEMWSTMGNIYNCKGDVVYTGSVDQAKEGMWWDGDLGREILSAPDGNGYNPMIVKYAGNGSYHYNRLIKFYEIMNYGLQTEYGCRPAFFGDIAGDWREEILLRKNQYINDSTSSCAGFYGFTTDYATDYSLYCLMQNAAYRGQTTTKGYYQSPYPDYYLGWDMSQPPLPPFIKTDLVWRSGTTWDASASSFTGYNENVPQPFTDGKSVMFDISGANADTVRLSGTLQPSVVYAQVPVNHDYVLGGKGTLAGSMDLWKSQNGRLVLNGSHIYTGKTIVSEGVLELNGSLASTPEIRAKGTLAGTAVLNNGINLQAGLNYEGGRLSPGNSAQPFSKITINGNTTFSGGSYLEMNLRTKAPNGTDTLIRMDTVQVNGDLTATGITYLYMKLSEENPLPGEYPLVRWTGTLTGDSTKFRIAGLKGLSTALKVSDNQLILVVKGQRAAQDSVIWMGSQSADWNFNDENFKIGEDVTPFVNGDKLYFTDESSTRTITLNEVMKTSGIVVDNNVGNYTFKGTGGFSSTGGLTKNGTGTLYLNTVNSDYTGPTVINGGILEVSSLADAGQVSSIGSASTAVANLVINNATLSINNVNTATNRGVTLTGEACINTPSGSGFAIFKGPIAGTGKLIKKGAGQLSVTNNGPTTYSGGTILEAGTIAMGTYNTSFGVFGSGLVMKGTSKAVIFNNNSTTQVPVFNYAVNVPAGASAYISGGQRCKVNGTLTGTGTLTFWTPYVRCDHIGNWSGFAGTLNIVSDKDGGQFRLCNANGLGGALVNLGDNVTLGHFAEGSASAQNLTSSIGALAGNATSNLCNGTYNIGGNNLSATFGGIISAGVTVNKYGSGIWTLTGANLNTSTTQVYGGTLTVANTTGSATGSGPVIVRNGGVLNGTGNIAGSVTLEPGSELNGSPTINGAVVAKSGATIQVGIPNTVLVKTLNINNSLTLQSGSNTVLKVFGGLSASGDKIAVSGTFNPGGTLTVSRPGTSAVQDGFTYQLFTAGTIGTTRFDSLSLPDLGAGMVWDTTGLYSAGKIVARNNSALQDVSSEVWSVTGTMVEDVCEVSLESWNGEAELRLLDSKGRSLRTYSVQPNSTMKVSLANQTPGLYFLVLQLDGRSNMKRIVKK